MVAHGQVNRATRSDKREQLSAQRKQREHHRANRQRNDTHFTTWEVAANIHTCSGPQFVCGEGPIATGHTLTLGGWPEASRSWTESSVVSPATCLQGDEGWYVSGMVERGKS